MYRAGYEQYNALYNLADLIAIVIMAFGIVPVISIIRLFLPKAPIIENCDNFIRGRFLIILVNVTYLKVAFACMMNFQFFDTDIGQSSAFNSFGSIVLLAYVIMVPVYYVAQAVIFSREIKSIKKKNEYQKLLKGEENAESRKVLDDKAKIVRNNFRAKTLFEEYNIDSPF